MSELLLFETINFLVTAAAAARLVRALRERSHGPGGGLRLLCFGSGGGNLRALRPEGRPACSTSAD
jgi:hypothetical protein